MKLAVLLAIVAFIGVNVLVSAFRARTYPNYWLNRMNEPVPPNGVRLVALGDSSVEVIGADQPMHGYVGRSAEYIGPSIQNSILALLVV